MIDGNYIDWEWEYIINGIDQKPFDRVIDALSSEDIEKHSNYDRSFDL